ncbi:hypothetical protein [Oceanicoccus sp. KOV_DT_Chl]|uniref:hypothetical protein n=1 Tax=Oceanicoccus sp. KOV_DT_Chl TaxID=1904639 RepID=UPI001358DCE3|nr:hypothetical protein [Oceanicoccus sp. KOV_DT_Chl]
MIKKYQHSNHSTIITAHLAPSFHRVLSWLANVAIPLKSVDIAGLQPHNLAP